jgi:hypothetical protein
MKERPRGRDGRANLDQRENVRFFSAEFDHPVE